MPKILQMAKSHVEAINSINSVSAGKVPKLKETGDVQQEEINMHRATISSLQATLEQLREENKDQGQKLT